MVNAGWSAPRIVQLALALGVSLWLVACSEPECTTNDDCPTASLCVNNECLEAPDCSRDDDCPSGLVCAAGGVCQAAPRMDAGSDAGTADAGTADAGDAAPPDAGDAGTLCVPADCDDGNPCTNDTCEPGGCVNMPNTVGCDDGVFCNGTDACSDGSCTEHGGDPCIGPTVCDEGMGVCAGCRDGDDCPSPITSEYGLCEGFDDACDETAEHRRTVTSFSCVDENCVPSPVIESDTCSRPSTDKNPCDDGTFCNGANECADGTCLAGANPCPGAVCDEGADMCRCSGMCGDVNQDGSLTSADAARATALAASGGASSCELADGDLDRDGAINDLDATLVEALRIGDVSGGCTSCTLGCGDINDSGDVTISDAVLSQTFASGDMTPDACQYSAADINRDLVVDDWDSELILAIAVGSTVTGGCVPCTGVCGDVDQDGDFDAADLTALDALVAGSVVPTICSLDAADVNRKDGVNDRDRQQAERLLVGTATAGCTTCPVRTCGDVNFDGAVNSGDISRIVALSGGTPTVCELNNGDVFGDGRLSEADADLIAQIFLDNVTGGCTTCSDACGDVNNDGAINVLDASAVVSISMSTDSIAACQFWRADVNNDGAITSTGGDSDADRISDFILESIPLACSD